LILYNGQTGSLGRYFADAVPANSDKLVALKARLEDRAALRAELMQLQVSRGEEVSLVQMAARVSVPACEADPEGTHKTNVMDTMATVSDFLDWAKLKGVEARVLFVSTGHVYAASSEALTEESPLGPRSVYAKSKLAAENALLGICDKRASLIIARVFGLVAPEQPGHYVLPGLMRRVRENDLTDVPGLDYIRDYIDARDVCRILARLTAMALWFDKPEVFNVCSGHPKSIRQIIQMIAWPDPVEPTAAPGRNDDVRVILGDPGKLVKATGWLPQTISLWQTIHAAREFALRKTLV
jgi:nucleoside-diphosphate-sugar epimerase